MVSAARLVKDSDLLYKEVRQLNNHPDFGATRADNLKVLLEEGSHSKLWAVNQQVLSVEDNLNKLLVFSDQVHNNRNRLLASDSRNRQPVVLGVHFHNSKPELVKGLVKPPRSIEVIHLVLKELSNNLLKVQVSVALYQTHNRKRQHLSA